MYNTCAAARQDIHMERMRTWNLKPTLIVCPYVKCCTHYYSRWESILTRKKIHICCTVFIHTQQAWNLFGRLCKNVSIFIVLMYKMLKINLIKLKLSWLKSINIQTAKTRFFVYLTWMVLLQIEVSFQT